MSEVEIDATGTQWRAHDLVEGYRYEARNWPLVIYCGLDHYCGETTHKFDTKERSIRQFQYVKAERLNEFLSPKDVPTSQENERLRKIISDCAAALGNGAFISPHASVEFMEGLPKEISLVVAGMQARA